jgi:hypothetical protein
VVYSFVRLLAGSLCLTIVTALNLYMLMLLLLSVGNILQVLALAFLLQGSWGAVWRLRC